LLKRVNDFSISLDDLSNLIDTTHLKTTIEENFVKDHEYIIKDNTFLVNIGTFKTLCGLHIRKAFIKLENIYNRFKDAPKTGNVYIVSCGEKGVYKCGRAKDPVKRIKGMQTACSSKVEILFVYPTNNDILLENVVHYILQSYRNSDNNREHFKCNLEYMKSVVSIVGKVIETLKNCDQTYSLDDLMSILGCNIEYTPMTRPMGIQTEQEIETELESKEDTGETFEEFLQNNVIYKEGAILQIKNVCESYTGREISPRTASVYRKRLEKFIKENKELRKHQVNYVMQETIKYKGFLHLILKEDICNDRFYQWLENNIEMTNQRSDYIELKIICEKYLKRTCISPKTSSKLKISIEEYIKMKYKDIDHNYRQLFISDAYRPRGWTHLKLI